MSSSPRIQTRNTIKHKLKDDGHDRSITSPLQPSKKTPRFLRDDFVREHVLKNTDAVRYAIGPILQKEFKIDITKIGWCDPNLDSDKSKNNPNTDKICDAMYTCDIRECVGSGIKREKKKVSLMVGIQNDHNTEDLKRFVPYLNRKIQLEDLRKRQKEGTQGTQFYRNIEPPYLIIIYTDGSPLPGHCSECSCHRKVKISECQRDCLFEEGMISEESFLSQVDHDSSRILEICITKSLKDHQPEDMPLELYQLLLLLVYPEEFEARYGSICPEPLVKIYEKIRTTMASNSDDCSDNALSIHQRKPVLFKKEIKSYMARYSAPISLYIYGTIDTKKIRIVKNIINDQNLANELNLRPNFMIMLTKIISHKALPICKILYAALRDRGGKVNFESLLDLVRPFYPEADQKLVNHAYALLDEYVLE